MLAPAVVFIALQAAWIRRPEVGIDFEVFRHAAERLLAGEPIYRFDEVFAFKYSPFAALTLAPLGLGAPLVAYWGWNVLNAAAYASFIAWAARGRHPLHIALAFACLLVLVQHHFALGQIDMLLFSAVALSERLREKHAFVSGLVLGLLPFYKLPLLLLFGLPVASREPKRLGGVALALALGVLTPALCFGLSGDLAMHRAWLLTLSQNTGPILCWRDNQSAFALPCAFGLAPHWGLLCAACVGAAIAWAALARGPKAELALFAAHVLSPLGWCTAFTGSLPLLADVIAQARGWRRFLLVPLAACALASRELMGGAAYARFLELRVYGFVYITLILLAQRSTAQRRQKAPP